ncbi:MAG TPA: hypothetical protein VF375_00900 [Candidatus Limnocylindrales bacterium]
MREAFDGHNVTVMDVRGDGVAIDMTLLIVAHLWLMRSLNPERRHSGHHPAICQPG